MWVRLPPGRYRSYEPNPERTVRKKRHTSGGSERFSSRADQVDLVTFICNHKLIGFGKNILRPGYIQRLYVLENRDGN